jgi:hypothetical protein
LIGFDTFELFEGHSIEVEAEVALVASAFASSLSVFETCEEVEDQFVADRSLQLVRPVQEQARVQKQYWVHC